MCAAKVWGYFSVGANGGIHEFADSQFGHLFASGATREIARRNLVLALKSVEVRGNIRNPVEYLVQLLETDAFKANTIDTGWLDGIIKSKAVAVPIDSHTIVLAAVIYRAWQSVIRETSALVENLKRGQLSTSGIGALNRFELEIAYEGVKYTFSVARASGETFSLRINGQTITTKVRQQPDGSLLATIGGATRKLHGMEEPLGLRMVVDGTTCLLPNIFDPSEVRSDLSCRIWRDGGDVATLGMPRLGISL